MFKGFILGSFVLFTFNSFSKVLNYETTRLKSTAGAGVASLLMDEATVLNPAPMAHFNISAIYFEKYGTSKTLKDSGSVSDASNMAFIASDSSKNLKGSISYIKSSNEENNLEQTSLAFASLIGKKSSAGVNYRKIKRTYNFRGEEVKEEYMQVIPGVFHAISKDFFLGFVAIDPLRKNEKETKVIVGAQGNISEYINLTLDLGADYKRELSETSLIRGAAQVKVLNDFLIRFGASEDKALKERSTGIGAGWIQPRLVVNFAIKNIKVSEDLELKQEDQDIKETSFSLSYRF